jgi:hypothetical protein
MKNQNLFEQQMQEADRQEQRADWKKCWPEWEGPTVGGWIEADDMDCLNLTTGRRECHYGTPCIVREISADGNTFLVEIKWDQADVKADEAPRQGQFLSLDVTQVWVPVQKLEEEMLAKQKKSGKKRGAH